MSFAFLGILFYMLTYTKYVYFVSAIIFWGSSSWICCVHFSADDLTWGFVFGIVFVSTSLIAVVTYLVGDFDPLYDGRLEG